MSLSLTLLGAGMEVGRSCVLLQYRGKKIICDAGVQPALSGIASLPFIDELDFSTVDALLITHCHLDHVAALTYITEKTNFRDGKGKVYMTHPTKALHKFVMQDFLRTSSSSSDTLFSPQDVKNSLDVIIPISVHEHITPCPGVSFTAYHAGHVLGACMFLVDIAGLKILYTGDYSREEDRHLVPAELPPVRPDVLIVESTFGVHNLESRFEQEQRLTALVHSIIHRGGHVLLPTFALGMAQELLLLLDEYWAKHPDLHNVPIYYASETARKAMAVYQTYIHTMNNNIRTRFAKRDNPWIFKYISHQGQRRGWEREIAAGPPCVVLTNPAFMQSGSSRELFELWAPDARNGLIITGYSIEGTLARDILTEPDEVQSLKGGIIPRKMSVAEISFSAHVDFAHNAEFIELVKAPHVVLVHGQQDAMMSLKAALTTRYKERNETVKIHTPRNLETLQLAFRAERVAKAVGTLADNTPRPNDVVSGVLLSHEFNNSYTLLDPRDLQEFVGVSACTVAQRQRLAVSARWERVRWHLQGMFGSVEEGGNGDGVPTIRVMGVVDVKQTREHELTLEWESSASNDMMADSIMALLAGIGRSSTPLHTHSGSSHPHADSQNVETRIKRLEWFMKAHFGQVGFYMPDGNITEPTLLVHLDGASAQINLVSLTVTSPDVTLRTRVEAVLDVAVTTVSSLGQTFTTGSAYQGGEMRGNYKLESRAPEGEHPNLLEIYD
ncbi:beta-lactamase-like protein [Mycena sanguinolenta]|nr:beta-lactamase-like protein [Mycena sanguinolenta]